MNDSAGEITRILASIRNGQRDEEARLFDLVYRELKRIAASHLRRERPDHTLQATALVHEAYLRLVGQEIQWQNRAHFFAVAANVMRRILVDYARSLATAKRQGGQQKIELDSAFAYSQSRSTDLIAMDEALVRLAKFDPRQCRIVELRFFGGMTEEEIGEVLGLSARTVKRDWRIAKAWLHGELTQ